MCVSLGSSFFTLPSSVSSIFILGFLLYTPHIFQVFLFLFWLFLHCQHFGRSRTTQEFQEHYPPTILTRMCDHGIFCTTNVPHNYEAENTRVSSFKMAEKYDLTSRVGAYLDRHLVFPLLEFLSSKEVYTAFFISIIGHIYLQMTEL